MRKTKFGTEQHDRPTHVQPNEQQGQRSKATIKRARLCGPNAHAHVRLLGDRKQNRGKTAAEQCGNSLDLGVWKKPVDEREAN